ncbi:radical SAM protein [Clostridioides mangenotii]|uniref:radical SAM/SPASM domain-containing protein n=1 Tax=Metaclostridioides mangenotii TaxID=1540 RepID=UPI00214A802D|nr:radical SAM protein [Clostridioides mangenotii]MCR1954637.1 radical SAM protein [Clostridioides mangenotii]
MYKFSKYSRNIINLNKVILAHIENGKWIRISKEVYDILNLGIENNMSIEELKSNLYDDDDREYIEDLYNLLCSMAIIEDENNKQQFKNKIASVEMTHRCNLKCVHCCIDADGVVSDKKDLSTEEMKNVFDKIVKWNPGRIMLSGGEPMLRKDFIELLKYLKLNYDGKIIVSTNGTLINEKNVKVLSECASQIDISLDGVDEESCSLVRGPGVFDKVINNVKLLKNTGFEKITLSMAISDRNEHLESGFNKLNESLGTSPLVRIFSPVGRGKDNVEVFSDKGMDVVYIPEDFLSDNYDKAFGACSCSAGKREIMITHSGDIYPCITFMNPKNKIGNIMEIEGLDYLSKAKDINKHPFMDILNSQIYEDCNNCKVNLFCWTCPGEFEELKGNESAFKYRCLKLKPALYKRVWER